MIFLTTAKILRLAKKIMNFSVFVILVLLGFCAFLFFSSFNSSSFSIFSHVNRGACRSSDLPPLSA